MYIIEKLIELYSEYKKAGNKNTIIPINEQEEELEDVITCKHNFMPIDSTGNILACSKCGYLINKSRLNKKD